MALEAPKEDYIFTPGERVRIIVCQIMASEKPVYVEDLMNTCMVSRNTIFTDLQAVITLLHAYQLGIGYEKKRGYWIDGDTIRARAFFPVFQYAGTPFLGREAGIYPYGRGGALLKTD